MSIFRRRLMMHRAETNPYDDFGYIKKGKTFHLDGIMKGNVADVWTDLVGGITFPIVSGVTFEDNHVHILNTASIFAGSSSVRIPYETYTLEFVGKDSYMSVAYRVMFHGGTSNSIIIADSRNAVAPALVWTSPNKSKTLLNATLNTVHIYSICNGLAYMDGVPAEYSDVPDNVNVGASVATLGSRGGSSPYKTTCDIYSVRVYNRKLSAEEMLYNQRIDNERFNLGLDI